MLRVVSAEARSLRRCRTTRRRRRKSFPPSSAFLLTSTYTILWHRNNFLIPRVLKLWSTFSCCLFAIALSTLIERVEFNYRMIFLHHKFTLQLLDLQRRGERNSIRIPDKSNYELSTNKNTFFESFSLGWLQLLMEKYRKCFSPLFLLSVTIEKMFYEQKLIKQVILMEKWGVEISTASLRWRNQCHSS